MRFRFHCEQTERLLSALESDEGSSLEVTVHEAQELQRRDDVFPDVLDTVTQILDHHSASDST